MGRFFSSIPAHPWLHAMQGRISASRPARVFATIAGSARCARAIPTASARPAAIIASASASRLKRQTAKTGAMWPAARIATRTRSGSVRKGAGSKAISAICVARE